MALPLTAGRVSPDPFALASGAPIAGYELNSQSMAATLSSSTLDPMPMTGDLDSRADDAPAVHGLEGVHPTGSQIVSFSAPDQTGSADAKSGSGGSHGAADAPGNTDGAPASLRQPSLRAQAYALLAAPGTPVGVPAKDETGLPICPPSRTPAMYLLRRAVLLLRTALELTALHCGGLR